MTRRGTILVWEPCFGSASFPCENAFEKCTTKTELFNGKRYTKRYKKFSYTLNCTLKCPSTFPYSYGLIHHLVFEKNYFIWTNNIFYSLRNQKWDKTNSWSLKYIENKYEVTLDFFANFAYVSSYLDLKDFAWKRG